ncbi:MAG: amidohydrolase family protein [Solirubrobacterales bacterium]
MSSLAISGALLAGERVGLRADGGYIVELGPEVRPREGDEVLEAGGELLVPPFVNAHGHSAMTLFRGFGDDLPLMQWLEEKIWPAEAKLEPSDVYWGARLACIEMVRSGTTRFFDIYWHGPEVARAAEDAGLRVVASAVLLDHLNPGGGARLRFAAMESLDALAAAGPLVEAALGPHAIYTVSRQSLEWIAEVSSSRSLGVQIHLSETEAEVSDCLEANGVRPAFYLDGLGLLGPRTMLAHGVWLDFSELELIAERGATVATNPAANMKLAVGGSFPYPAAAAAGVQIALGTDGVSSNNNLDMFEEVKLLALLAKHAAADPSVLPASEALEIARGRRSELAGGTPLKPGAPADFLLLDGELPELSAGDPDAGLVYSANGSVVQTAVVAGRVVMHNRAVEGEAEVRAEVSERAARLTH